MLCLQEVERTDLDSFLGFDMSRYAKIESDLRTFRENCEFCGFFLLMFAVQVLLAKKCATDSEDRS